MKSQRERERDGTHPLLDVAQDLREALAETFGLGTLARELVLHAHVLAVDFCVAPAALLPAHGPLRRWAERERRRRRRADAARRRVVARKAVAVRGGVGVAALERLAELADARLEGVGALALLEELVLQLGLALDESGALLVECALDVVDALLALVLALLHEVDEATHARHLGGERGLARAVLLARRGEVGERVGVARLELLVGRAQLVERRLGRAGVDRDRVELALELDERGVLLAAVGAPLVAAALELLREERLVGLERRDGALEGLDAEERGARRAGRLGELALELRVGGLEGRVGGAERVERFCGGVHESVEFLRLRKPLASPRRAE